MDYQNGKIYRLDCNITGEVYIGSTCQPTVAKRLAHHVSSFKQWKKTSKGFLSSFSIIERDKYSITMIELYPCNSKDELHSREGFYIRSMVCVNKQIAGRTHKEWANDNKEALLSYQKQYCKDNKVKIKERLKQSYVDNKEYRLDIMHKYYEANKTEIRAKQNEYKKEYYLKNIEKIKQKRLKKLKENADLS